MVKLIGLPVFKEQPCQQSHSLPLRAPLITQSPIHAAGLNISIAAAWVRTRFWRGFKVKRVQRHLFQQNPLDGLLWCERMKCKSTGIFARALFFPSLLIDKMRKLAKGWGERPQIRHRGCLFSLEGNHPGNCCYEPETGKSPVRSVKPLGVPGRQWKEEAMTARTSDATPAGNVSTRETVAQRLSLITLLTKYLI